MAEFQPVPTTCEKCGQLFPSRLAFFAHRQTCKESFPCGQCGERLTSKAKLLEHAKTHRVRFTCDQCDTPVFLSQGALDTHKHQEHGAEIKCACGKAYSRADHLKHHMKACTATGPSLVCDCGAALQTMDKFHAHQEGCVLSRPGASRAVKRRFEELEDDDREAAALQAFADITRVARAKLAVTCDKCGASYVNVSKLRRHQRSVGH